MRSGAADRRARGAAPVAALPSLGVCRRRSSPSSFVRYEGLTFNRSTADRRQASIDWRRLATCGRSLAVPGACTRQDDEHGEDEARAEAAAAAHVRAIGGAYITFSPIPSLEGSNVPEIAMAKKSGSADPVASENAPTASPHGMETGPGRKPTPCSSLAPSLWTRLLAFLCL